MKSEFLTSLRKEDINDKEFFILQTLIYRSEFLKGVVKVPAGFSSDGSSTPRVPVAYWLYGDKAHHEGVLHDYFYRVPNHAVEIVGEGIVERRALKKEEADKVFLEAMKSRGKSFWVYMPMYWAVKFGGSSSWKTGESRYKIIPISGG